MLILRRLLHAVDNHGLRGSLRLVLGRSCRLRERDFPLSPHPFDANRGIDTSGYIAGEALASGPSRRWFGPDLYNTAYYGIAPSALSQALALLPDAVEDFTFVDLGCGKGRALLVAGELPFRKLVGIELSPALCRIAEQNTAADARVTIQNSDAADVIFPVAPLVVFLYHPFLAPVLRRLLGKLEQQFRKHPRDLWLLYANPTYPRVLARFPFLHPVWDVRLALSPEDAAADRHGITDERFTLFHARL